MKKLLLTLTGVSTMMTALFAQAPADLEVCAGKGYTLTNAKSAEGAAPITYAWFENDVAVPDAGSASLTITEGRGAGIYAYVRTASNADCSFVSSNTFTVQVRQAGAAGEPRDPTCGCASGLVNCSGTCTTNTTSVTNDGACTGNCHQAYRQRRNACGVVTNSEDGTYIDTSICGSSCQPQLSLCSSNFQGMCSSCSDGDSAAACQARCRTYAQGWTYYNYSVFSEARACSCYRCN
jgi:hypothetical protein